MSISGTRGEATFARASCRLGTTARFLLFRGQTLTDQDLIARSAEGSADPRPGRRCRETGRRFVEGLPEIYIVSNVKVNGEPIGSLGDGEAVWHTDMSYLDLPPKASMLYALEMPADRRQHVVLHHVRHLRGAARSRSATASPASRSSTMAPSTAAAMCARASRRPTIRAHSPGAVHPLVCTHPGDRPAHALPRPPPQRLSGQGSSSRDSEALLDELWSVRRPAASSAGSSVWRVGDLVRGTTAAPCIGAMLSILSSRRITRAAPRSRATRGRSDQSAIRLQEVGCDGGDLLTGGVAALSAPLRRVRSSAAKYPDRPIRLVVPLPPGGGYDAVGRPFGPTKMKSVLGTDGRRESGGGGSSARRRCGRPRARTATPSCLAARARTSPRRLLKSQSAVRSAQGSRAGRRTWCCPRLRVS